MTEETEPTAVRARWLKMAPLLLPRESSAGVGSASNATWAWAVANADYSSPVHGGLLLFRANASLYLEGLRVLSNEGFNHTHGFGLVGPPRSLGLRPRHLDGARATDVGFGNDPLTSGAMKRNGWEFVNANSDQGFFWYMFFIRHQRGAYFRYFGNAHHKILHWWTGLKPWDALAPQAVPGIKPWDGHNQSLVDGVFTHLLVRAYSYLQRSDLTGGADAKRAHPIVHSLWKLRRDIENDPRWPYFRLKAGSVSTLPIW